MKLLLSDNAKDAIEAAAQQVVDAITIDAFLFVSGGSSFAVFQRVDQLLTTDQKENTRLLLVDERYGKIGHADSNWNLMRDIDTTDYASVYPVLVDDELSLEETADEYEEVIQMAFESDAQTIAILGIGEDRHIAGIKPMKEKSFNVVFSAMYVSGYRGHDYERITLSPAALPLLDLRIVYAAGANKAPAIAGLATDMPLHESPMHILKDLENTFIYNVND